MVQEQEAELSRTSASSQISSLSTSFDGSSSSFIRETGNPTLDKGSLRLTCPLLNGNVDLLEVAEYFDCEIEPPEEENIFVVIIKLPYYGQHNWLREFCFLRVRAHLKEDTYRAEYDLAKLAPAMEKLPAGLAEEAMSSASIQSHKICKNGHPSIVCFIDSFYFMLESLLHPNKEVTVRDFCYSVYDPRHWGRPLPGQLDRLSGGGHGVWKARARFDFQAAMEGELSIKENETLLVLANLGNGWLSARRQSPARGEEDENVTGLVPENYVQKIQ